MAIERLAFSDTGGDSDFLEALRVAQLLYLDLLIQDRGLVFAVLTVLDQAQQLRERGSEESK